MPRLEELAADALCRGCDPERLSFASTAELEPLDEVLGQPRAVAAVEFGVAMERDGYNLFVFGPSGTGRHAVVREFLERRARERPAPSDWCYVHHFADPQRPRVLPLPAGMGARFRHDMEQLVDDLRSALAGALESEEYQTRRQMIEEQMGERQQSVLEEVGQHAERKGLRMIASPAGIVFVPVRDGQVVPPRELQKLPDEEKERLEGEVAELQQELQKALRQMPRWQRERRDAVLELNRQVTRFAAGSLIEELRERYQEVPAITEYLKAVEQDVVENARAFVGRGDGQSDGPFPVPVAATEGDHPFLRRYRVNVVVDNGGVEGAPVIYEVLPTHANLVGRVEHVSQMGALVTDFNLIRGGSLHRANGGYLILDALEVLRQPFAWQGLKRALRSHEIKIESLGEVFSLIHTLSLEPETIPLSVKVVLTGERWVYYLLSALDPDVADLFKVEADFDDRCERNDDAELRFARLVARLVKEEDLTPLDRGAVARAIDHAARLAGDGERLSLDVRRTRDLLREADHWAREAGRDVVTREDVERALDEKHFRADRLKQRVQEEMLRGTLDVATDGAVVGQVNGLSVLELGDFAFGRPSRITARVRLGGGEVVDIEREVELSGPLHSKGVLILAGFLGERFAADTPLSLSASLVFEQLYAGVDGDSASSAELYALLSAIAGVPLRQSLAVTGSVNQHGRVQAIGGVNEKIEGFFDLCAARGLTGEQGVLIPASNTVHLMLRHDVVDAVRAGRFHVYPVGTVDEGIELLTGLEAGERREDGSFPDGSVNARVQARLVQLAERRQQFVRPAAGGPGAPGGEEP